uniref:YqaJ viral recombinase domain-containing protein n=1 Tax=viral metagenome TaxID=1070528 RepID=A0A6C0ILQ7_9ZZZZ
MDIDTDTNAIGAEIESLINILDNFVLPDAFTSEEEIEIIETAYSLIKDLIGLEPMSYIQPYFHDYIILEVTELLIAQMAELNTYSVEEEITLCVEQAMKLFYRQDAPKRSFKKSFIRIKPNIPYLRDKLLYLQNVPQPEQRTTEWYNFRYRYLTASSIWKAFISESTKNQLIFDKCKPLNIEKYNHTSTDSPMHWGHKYEPISVQLYEDYYKTTVSDFGCIPHATIGYLAASPDGINTLETSPRYGRMLEIKNIVNREIDGIPKMEYWIQMQLQMEVCNLNECDFLETRFKEYVDEAEYLEDSLNINISKTQDGKQKGMMIQFMSYGQPVYEYAPLNADRQYLLAWEEEMMYKHEKDIWVKNIYWRLDEMSCVLVLRNKFWFKHAVPILDDIWQTIEYEKINGYEHRSPNKKIKLDKNVIVVKSDTKCCIDLFTIDTEMYNAEDIL